MAKEARQEPGREGVGMGSNEQSGESNQLGELQEPSTRCHDAKAQRRMDSSGGARMDRTGSGRDGGHAGDEAGGTGVVSGHQTKPVSHSSFARSQLTS